ncbi:MAG: hypothetical protein SGPRY_000897 [Prymnesium sp.]
MASLALPLPAWLTAESLCYACVAMSALLLLRLVYHPSVPSVTLPHPDVLATAQPPAHAAPAGELECRDPSTGAFLGLVPCEGEAAVYSRVKRARLAQAEWARSSFSSRRQLLRIVSKCVLEHASEICRVSARDSGKTTTDAAFGEVLVTLEKLHWLCAEGEKALKPERRSPGRMLFYKARFSGPQRVARVEWHPRGVLGAIVPWNYPFHNILNPVSAAIFSGNAIIVKVSEHSLWSSQFYAQLLAKCLEAANAPADLVQAWASLPSSRSSHLSPAILSITLSLPAGQIIPGDGTTGAALTRSVDMMTFVGSTRVGKMVMREASNTLTPVVLELGGKDPFVLLPAFHVQGANVDAIVDVAARAGWGASGQNCIGAERFFVHSSLFEEFSHKICAIASKMRQPSNGDALLILHADADSYSVEGPPLNSDGDTGVDIGAMCLPGEVKRIQSLVVDAVAHGAKASLSPPQVMSQVDRSALPHLTFEFFEPTVVIVSDAKACAGMRLFSEEVFGPLITVISFETDDDLVAMCNDCPFALGSSIFGSDSHVDRVGKRIQAGMLASNDFATCYMCQSLPMGGLKDSGFGKFAGIEGLRGCCVTKAVVEDRFSFMRTQARTTAQAQSLTELT